mgnify:FL=1
MDSTAAIQVSILLSFVIAILLARGLFKSVDITLLKRLIVGTLVGAPFGILAFQYSDITTLKIFAIVAVLFMIVSALGVFQAKERRGSPGTAVEGLVGVVSGIMYTVLAMPGRGGILDGETTE